MAAFGAGTRRPLVRKKYFFAVLFNSNQRQVIQPAERFRDNIKKGERKMLEDVINAKLWAAVIGLCVVLIIISLAIIGKARLTKKISSKHALNRLLGMNLFLTLFAGFVFISSAMDISVWKTAIMPISLFSTSVAIWSSIITTNELKHVRGKVQEGK